MVTVTHTFKPTPINPRIKPTVMLSSGHTFDYSRPETSLFTIEDVAHSLARLCRFAGHIRGEAADDDGGAWRQWLLRRLQRLLGATEEVIYSVAQHSVLVSTTCPPEHALVGLLHDLAEMVMVDVPGPLKNLLPEYKALEARVEAAMLRRCGLSYPLDPSVKTADLRVLATEQRDLRGGNADHLGTWDMLQDVEPLPERIVPWSVAESKRRFLARYAELAGGLVVGIDPAASDGGWTAFYDYTRPLGYPPQQQECGLPSLLDVLAGSAVEDRPRWVVHPQGCRKGRHHQAPCDPPEAAACVIDHLHGHTAARPCRVERNDPWASC